MANPFAGAGGKAHTQAGPPATTARYRRRSHRGRYHADRQPRAALQNTAICPAGPPPARSRAAWAAVAQQPRHGDQPRAPLVPVAAAFR